MVVSFIFYFCDAFRSEIAFLYSDKNQTSLTENVQIIFIQNFFFFHHFYIVYILGHFGVSSVEQWSINPWFCIKTTGDDAVEVVICHRDTRADCFPMKYYIEFSVFTLNGNFSFFIYCLVLFYFCLFVDINQGNLIFMSFFFNFQEKQSDEIDFVIPPKFY